MPTMHSPIRAAATVPVSLVEILNRRKIRNTNAISLRCRTIWCGRGRGSAPTSSLHRRTVFRYRRRQLLHVRAWRAFGRQTKPLLHLHARNDGDVAADAGDVAVA